MAAAAKAAGRGGPPAPAASVVAAVASTLTARYQEAWPLALPGRWNALGGSRDWGRVFVFLYFSNAP